ncbi:MAG: glycosyltransferase [Dechloromonas sp.]|nr:glycosyltransferase [Dechloromonas sp.]
MGQTESKSDIVDICEPETLLKSPAVSVLILTYNHEKYISRAIEGAISQQCSFPIEIVIAEDCSTDRTIIIAKAYQRMRPDIIRIITGSANVGIYANLKRGVEFCRAPYVAFCEGDDYWVDSRKLDIQINSLRSSGGIEISFHSTFFLKESEGFERGPYLRASSRSCVVAEERVLREGGSFMPTASIIVSTKVLRGLPSWIEHAGGAIDVYVQAYASRGKGAIYIDRPMSVYRREVPGSWATLQNADLVRQIDFKFRRLRSLSAMKSDFKNQSRAINALIFSESIEAIRIIRRLYANEAAIRAKETVDSYVDNMNMMHRFLAKISRMPVIGHVYIFYFIWSRKIIRIMRKILINMKIV